MNVLVTVVGGKGFLARFVPRVSQLVAAKVQGCLLADAIVQIQTQLPNLIIVQASQADSLKLCRQIKEQNSLEGIYCLVVDDRIQCSPEIPLEQIQELLATADALENGADAYLRLVSKPESDTTLIQAEDRLLTAQIQLGMRGVQMHRELQHMNDLLSTMALADPLTELSNRRALEWELPRQIQNARSQETSLGLIILDVDFFKVVNDTYGHQIGDRILQLLAARLRHHLRLQDTLFRYGGEEFVIILTQTTFQEANLVAGRLRKLVGEQDFTINETTALNITISIGISSLRAADDPKGESLINRADQNLLRAKSAGRNRVVAEESS
ncbi:MAG: GGDEF domain-containing protein [Kastovskya adunca ATA6-11-RM4]|jgi:two-component system cell cycle response regulator|nr:GGDEF domain-containing protein [Kastovskya adunca ATA6-11-RM4]